MDEDDAMLLILQGRMDALEHRIDGLASMNDSLYTANTQLQHQVDSLSAPKRKKAK